MTPLYGELSVGLLVHIENNAKMDLLYRNVRFACEPFGVITLEKMVSQGSGECKEAVASLYRSHPSIRHFGRRHLYRQQSYHFETMKEGCILYGNGPETYSEMLLRHGLGIIDPALDNSEWNMKFKKAQRGGEAEKMGLHATSIREACQPKK